MNFNIPFNKPPYTGNEDKYVLEAMRSVKISGDGEFGKRCQHWFEKNLGCKKALLTPSCTHALEMSAMLVDIQPGDEVIMPSYTFVSTANAFVLRGAKILFIDIRPDTMNIDENLIENAITEKTKAIVVVHYAGVGCEMDKIIKVAEKYKLWVIEDAAQGIMSKYKDKYLGTIGHLGAISFHETKNITSGGEGGVLIINDKRFIERAEIIREKGTNRSQFFRGMVDKYTWVDIGSSFLMNEISAAFLWGQIQSINEIIKHRLKIWNTYYESLKPLEERGMLQLPQIPSNCQHNGHIFYVKLKDIEERQRMIEYLKQKSIMAVFHYVPLHSSPAGRKFGVLCGIDKFTTKESERLLRLPIYYKLSVDEVKSICELIHNFFVRRLD